MCAEYLVCPSGPITLNPVFYRLDQPGSCALADQQIHRRLRAVAKTAGLGDNFSGHSARVGMARDLAASGVALPALMTAGRWTSPTMPARYTRGVGRKRGRCEVLRVIEI